MGRRAVACGITLVMDGRGCHVAARPLLGACRHGFDGSGADNFFSAGSCIDGRLTSAWEWSACLFPPAVPPRRLGCCVHCLKSEGTRWHTATQRARHSIAGGAAPRREHTMTSRHTEGGRGVRGRDRARDRSFSFAFVLALFCLSPAAYAHRFVHATLPPPAARCNTLEKKPYFPVFLLTGFIGLPCRLPVCVRCCRLHVSPRWFAFGLTPPILVLRGRLAHPPRLRWAVLTRAWRESFSFSRHAPLFVLCHARRLLPAPPRDVGCAVATAEGQPSSLSIRFVFGWRAATRAGGWKGGFRKTKKSGFLPFAQTGKVLTRRGLSANLPSLTTTTRFGLLRKTIG